MWFIVVTSSLSVRLLDISFGAGFGWWESKAYVLGAILCLEERNLLWLLTRALASIHARFDWWILIGSIGSLRMVGWFWRLFRGAYVASNSLFFFKLRPRGLRAVYKRPYTVWRNRRLILNAVFKTQGSYAKTHRSIAASIHRTWTDYLWNYKLLSADVVPIFHK